jgi:hypothetical protein
MSESQHEEERYKLLSSKKTTPLGIIKKNSKCFAPIAPCACSAFLLLLPIYVKIESSTATHVHSPANPELRLVPIVHFYRKAISPPTRCLWCRNAWLPQKRRKNCVRG